MRNRSLTVGWRVLLVLVAVGALATHPAVGVGTVLGAGLVLFLVRRRVGGLRGIGHDISITDTMSGPDFERYVAALMSRSGFRRVRVSGGAGDMGADIIASCPDGRRVVVQCKRYRGKLRSPDVQRFAGTARAIHRADEALLVTTGVPTAQARDVARLCRIRIVDRAALARWVATAESSTNRRFPTMGESVRWV